MDQLSIEVAGKWDEFGAPPRFAQVIIWPSCKAGRVSIKSYLDYLQFCFTWALWVCQSRSIECFWITYCGSNPVLKLFLFRWETEGLESCKLQRSMGEMHVFSISCPFGANIGHCIDWTNIYKPPAREHAIFGTKAWLQAGLFSIKKGSKRRASCEYQCLVVTCSFKTWRLESKNCRPAWLGQ